MVCSAGPVSYTHLDVYKRQAGSLACGGFEVPVAQTSASAFQQDDFLFVLGDVADIFTRFGVVHHCACLLYTSLLAGDVFVQFDVTFAD